MPEPVIRNVSDTARWTAAFRARESERPDALFRDPVARKLAGERGEQIVEEVKFGTKHTWSWVTRTYLFDRFIDEELKRGADMVINLAAGLDARPYRMNVSPDVQWVEVDLPEITEYKEAVLRDDKPRCQLRRVKMDVANGAARRELFAELASRTRHAVVLSEGLLIYLTPREAGELADDLAAQGSFRRWIFDMASPAILKMMQKKMGAYLLQANAPLKFAPPDGPQFFTRHGWRVVAVESTFHTAGKLGRLPLLMRPWRIFPPPADGAAGEKRPWSGVSVLENAKAGS